MPAANLVLDINEESEELIIDIEDIKEETEEQIEESTNVEWTDHQEIPLSTLEGDPVRIPIGGPERMMDAGDDGRITIRIGSRQL